MGYLAFEQESSRVYIPNSEVAEEFVRSVKGCKWKEVTEAIEHSRELLRATWEQGEKKVAEILDRVHQQNMSILAYNDETTSQNRRMLVNPRKNNEKPAEKESAVTK